MSRVEELRAKYEAELALAALEDELAAAKGDPDWCTACGRRIGATSPDLADLKLRVREARRAFRAERAGDAAAAPDVIEVTSDVPSLEG